MKKTVEERLKDFDNEVVCEAGYTRGQLHEVFSWVQDPEDWKAPIDKAIGYHYLTVDMLKHAIPFYTATEATFTKLDNGLVRVQADGYRLGPAGDH